MQGWQCSKAWSGGYQSVLMIRVIKWPDKMSCHPKFDMTFSLMTTVNAVPRTKHLEHHKRRVNR